MLCHCGLPLLRSASFPIRYVLLVSSFSNSTAAWLLATQSGSMATSFRQCTSETGKNDSLLLSIEANPNWSLYDDVFDHPPVELHLNIQYGQS